MIVVVPVLEFVSVSDLWVVGQSHSSLTSISAHTFIVYDQVSVLSYSLENPITLVSHSS